MQCHVINGSDIAQDLRTLIEADDLEVIVSSKHRPRCIIDFISQSLRLLNLEESKLNVLVICYFYVLCGCPPYLELGVKQNQKYVNGHLIYILVQNLIINLTFICASWCRNQRSLVSMMALVFANSLQVFLSLSRTLA